MPLAKLHISSPYPVPQEHANAHSPALGQSAHCPEEQLADSSLVHFTVARTEPPGTEGWALPMGFLPAATRPYEHPRRRTPAPGVLPAAGAGARGPLPGATSCSMTATFDGSPPRHRQLLDRGSESTPKDPREQPMHAVSPGRPGTAGTAETSCDGPITDGACSLPRQPWDRATTLPHGTETKGQVRRI